MTRTQRATGGRRSTGIAWAVAGLLAACGGATVSGTHGAGVDGGGSGGLAASGGAGATAGVGGLPSSGGTGAGGSDASAGASGTGAVAGGGGTAGDAAAGAGGSDAGCPTGYADCNGDPSDGCETPLATDVNHCGGCAIACSVNNGTPICLAGACRIANCYAGYADCDGLYATGCETNLRLDPANCGSCGNQCPSTNGTPSCVNGTCSLCGCSPPYADCDGNCANGCETDTAGDVNNCGFCGNACTVKHGTPACSGGSCSIASCDPGYADCDGLYSTGCETNLAADANNCGACGQTCSTPNGSGSCVNGSCICGCSAGYADCNGTCADGCETNVSSNVNHCGGCGIVCGSQHALAQCISGMCQPKCDPGWGDCDGNPVNGCETDLASDVNNCGGCGTACSASGTGCATCVGGVCGLCACTPPYADCDGNPATFCETNLASDVNNCGACGQPCATGQSCVSGSCQ